VRTPAHGRRTTALNPFDSPKTCLGPSYGTGIAFRRRDRPYLGAGGIVGTPRRLFNNRCRRYILRVCNGHEAPTASNVAPDPWPNDAAREGGCPNNPAPTAHVPRRHLGTIAQLPWQPPCSFRDRANVLAVRRARDGPAYSNSLLASGAGVRERASGLQWPRVICSSRNSLGSASASCHRRDAGPARRAVELSRHDTTDALCGAVRIAGRNASPRGSCAAMRRRASLT